MKNVRIFIFRGLIRIVVLVFGLTIDGFVGRQLCKVCPRMGYGAIQQDTGLLGFEVGEFGLKQGSLFEVAFQIKPFARVIPKEKFGEEFYRKVRKILSVEFLLGLVIEIDRRSHHLVDRAVDEELLGAGVILREHDLRTLLEFELDILGVHAFGKVSLGGGCVGVFAGRECLQLREVDLSRRVVVRAERDAAVGSFLIGVVTLVELGGQSPGHAVLAYGRQDVDELGILLTVDFRKLHQTIFRAEKHKEP